MVLHPEPRLSHSAAHRRHQRHHPRPLGLDDSETGDQRKVWRPGEIFVFDDTYEHEVYNNTDEERVILLFDFNRPMGMLGRAVNNTMLSAMKMTAFYQAPRKNLADQEDRFEAATRQNTENLEKLSDD
jgi:ornithine lipid ester-linked acyl 2-hydroxylase